MRRFIIHCPVCKQENDTVSEEDLKRGFRLNCKSCGLSVHIEDGQLPGK